MEKPLASDVISLNPAVVTVTVMVSPETLIEDTIARMGEAQSSYVIITEQQRPVGIFTERDLVRLIASAEPIKNKPVSTVMSQPVRSLRTGEATDAFSLSQHMQQHGLRHLPIVNKADQLVGIVTQESLRKTMTFSTLLRLKRVEDVMTTQVICASLTDKVRQLAKKMAAHQVSCIVILDAENLPVGIITERDVVQFQNLDLDLSQTQAKAVMSTPLFPIHLKDSLWDTHQHMNQRRVRRFVVCTAEGTLAGLVTQSSLLQALDPTEVRHMIELLQQEAEQLRVENQALLEARNHELEQSALNLSTKLRNEQKEHHQADDKVRFQAGLLAAVAQAVIATDLSGQILYWNPYAESLYGWQSAEVLGRSILDITPTHRNQREVAEVMACLQQGAQWSGEFVAGRKDGSSFPAWVLASPIYDQQGTLVGVVGISDDISDRKRLEAERTEVTAALQRAYDQLDQSHEALESRIASRTAKLRQAEHRWRTLLENVQLVVIGLDTAGKVTYANPFFLKLTGYTAKEVTGVDWFDRFIPPSEHPEITDYFQQLHCQRTVPLQYQNAILTHSDEKRLILWNNTVLHDLQNNIIGTMSIGEDITERFAIARMKGEFIAMVSHELRTPLTAIHGGIKLLSQGIVPSQSEQAQNLLQVVTQSSQRLVRLVDDILELERLESGKHPLQKQWLNTQAVTHQVIDELQVIARKANVSIDLNDPGRQVLADSDRLKQVFTNLLDNAIKFSPPNSTIQIVVTAHNRNSTLFTVRDWGKGIPTEQCTTIFERFTQADGVSASGKDGTGLGLTICQSIVEQHGGTMWVESTLGEGSCFYFTIPKPTLREEQSSTSPPL